VRYTPDELQRFEERVRGWVVRQRG
jgi:hypothetical protein